MGKKMLLLGDSNETLEFLQYAKERNIYTIVTDYFEPEYSAVKLLADEYWMISTGELDALEQKCREGNVSAVISGASDFNIEMSIRLSGRLGLSCYCTEEVWAASKDKALFKKLCRECGVLTPDDYEVSTALTRQELDNIIFPVMVKPVNLCSNTGVSYCYNEEEFIKAYRYAESLSNKQEIIVERMLDGLEFCSYYVLAEGEAAFLTLDIRIPQPGEPKYCYSMNTTMNPFTERYLKDMDAAAIKLLKRIGCREGIACVQCILDRDGHFYAFEMCYCPETSMLIAPLRKICSFDAILWQFDFAIGKKHSKNQLPKNIWQSFKGCANSYIIFSKKEGIVAEISGLEDIKAFPDVELRFHIHEGDTIKKYYPLGNIMFHSDDYEQVYKMIEWINKTLRIRDELGEDMIIYFTDYTTLKRMWE